MHFFQIMILKSDARARENGGEIQVVAAKIKTFDKLSLKLAISIF